MSNLVSSLKAIGKAQTKPVEVKPYSFKEKTINPEALKQDQYWRDAKGKVHVIQNMHPLHAKRCIGKLFSQFETLEVINSPLYDALSARRG